MLRRVAWFLCLVVSSVLGIIIFSTVLAQMIGWPEDLFVYRQYIQPALAVSLSVGGAVGLYYAYKSLPHVTSRQYKLICVGAASLVVVTHLVVAYGLMSYAHPWDAGAVDLIARYYVEHGTTQIPNSWYGFYLATYENNEAIVLLLSSVYGGLSSFFGNDFVLYAQLVNSVAILGTVGMTVYIAHTLYGRRSAMVALLFCYILIVLSPYAPVVYTDTIGMFFVAGIATSALLLKNSSGKMKWFWSAVLGVALAFGYMIKPTVVFMGLAIALALIIKVLIRGRGALLYAVPAIIVVVAAGASISLYKMKIETLPNFSDYSDKVLDKRTTPIEHFLAMGSLRGQQPYTGCTMGTFCPQFVEYMQSVGRDVDTLDERREYGLRIWKESVKQDFPYGYSGLLMRKMVYQYSDGSFGVWKEGENRNSDIVFVHDDPLANSVRYFMGPEGKGLDILKSLLQVAWMITLLLLALHAYLGVRSREYRQNFWVLTLSMALIGVTLFLMVFESRPRYLFLYLPVIILIAVGPLAYLHTMRLPRKRKPRQTDK